MSALAAKIVSEPVEATKTDVLIHVRYTPSGDIFFIDATPEGVTPKAWLERLLAAAPDCYQTFAGGRGFFRIPSARFDAI